MQSENSHALGFCLYKVPRGQNHRDREWNNGLWGYRKMAVESRSLMCIEVQLCKRGDVLEMIAQ